MDGHEAHDQRLWNKQPKHSGAELEVKLEGVSCGEPGCQPMQFDTGQHEASNIWGSTGTLRCL